MSNMNKTAVHAISYFAQNYFFSLWPFSMWANKTKRRIEFGYVISLYQLKLCVDIN